MEVKINENISLLDEVKLQARVLFPILQALRNEFGEKRVNQVIIEALRNWSKSELQNQGENIKGSPGEKWASIMTGSMARIGNDVDIEWIKQNPDELEFKITGCRYADFFRDHDETELGSALLCETDIHTADLGAPEIEFKRTQTIMKGAKHCDFHYCIKK